MSGFAFKLLQNLNEFLDKHVALFRSNSGDTRVCFSRHVLGFKVNESVTKLSVLRPTARLHLEMHLKLPWLCKEALISPTLRFVSFWLRNLGKVGHWRRWSEWGSFWYDVIYDDPAVVTSSEQPVHIFVLQGADILKARAEFNCRIESSKTWIKM